MRTIISAVIWTILLAVFCSPAAAQPAPSYVFLLEGKGVPAGTIHVFGLNPLTGALAEVPGSPFTAGLGPVQVAIDPTNRFLYVTNQNSQDITGFSIDAGTGALTLLPGSPFSIGAVPVTMAVDPTGRFLYVFAETLVNGVSQQALFEYTIDSVSGALISASSSPVTWEPNPGRLITSMAFNPTGNLAYLGQSVSGGTDGPILISTVDFTTGALTRVGLTQPVSAEADGLGLTPGGNFLFSISKPNNEIDAFAVSSTGQLSEISGSPFDTGNVPVGIVVHPSVNFLYVVNENQAYQANSNATQYTGSVSAFGIGAASGALSPVQGSPFPAGINTSSIGMDPTGSFAYVAATSYVTGTYSGFAQIQGFSIDSSSGILSPFPSAAWTDSAQSTGSQLVISRGAPPAPNPVPMISSLSPPFAAAAGPAFTLQINGANFVQGSTAYFAGQPRNTTFVSATQLNVSILTSDISNEGTAVVFVFNPLPGGGTSTSVEFTLTSPAPVVTILSPTSVIAGSSNAGISIGGSNFLTSSVVNFNGAPLPTIYVSPILIRAQIPAADLVAVGTATITVTNPPNGGVGGGTSGSLTLMIAPPPAPFTVTGISPASTVAGGPAFTLTVNGSGFVAPSPGSPGSAGSQVSFGLASEPTTFVNSTQLTASIPASAIAISGNPYVIVTNPGGATSTPVTFTANSPPPGGGSVTPPTLLAGSNALTLNVTGTGFQPNSIVLVNGSPRPTTYVNSTLLKVTLLASDISQGGTLNITVLNPPPGGGVSPQIRFTVTNPQPTEISISPQSFAVGSGASTLIVTGTGFVADSVMSVNGSALDTTYQGSTTLQATLPANDLAQAGTLDVTITNSSPGGGVSPAIGVTVVNPPPVVISITPPSLTVSSSAVPLVIAGTGFVSMSVVSVNGSALVTTYNDSSSLQATLPTRYLMQGGTLEIVVSNPAPGGGAAAAVSLNVADFSVVPTNPSLSVTAGLPAIFNFTVSSTNGTFSNPVTLAVASQLPAGAVATPATIPAASGQSVTLFITTTARTSILPATAPRNFRPGLPVLCFSVACALSLLWIRSGRDRVRRLAPQFLLALLLLVAGGLVACSGLASSSPQSNPSPGTPAGTYPITVVATSGSVSHSVIVTLTVM